MNAPRLLTYAALLLLTQCAKCKDGPEPVDQLPPATQEGKNTFGCLVNGQAWTPKGNNGTPNFRADYDLTFDGGTLQVSAYRYPRRDEDTSQRINLLCRNLPPGPGTYPITLSGDVDASYFDGFGSPDCQRYRSSNPRLSARRGTLTITRLDLQAGVVAGTFAYTLALPGCDTVRVTDGRFDYRLY